MILFANFLSAVAKIAHIVLVVYMWIIIFRVIFSWLHSPYLYQLKLVLYYLTEPLLKPLRRVIPPHKIGGIDLSPFLAILGMMFVDLFLVKSLSLYAAELLRKENLGFL